MRFEWSEPKVGLPWACTFVRHGPTWLDHVALNKQSRLDKHTLICILAFELVYIGEGGARGRMHVALGHKCWTTPASGYIDRIDPNPPKLRSFDAYLGGGTAVRGEEPVPQ